VCAIWWEKILETIYSTFFVFSFLLTVFFLRVLLSSYLYLLYLMCICCTMCVLLFLLHAGLLARNQFTEVPATGQLDTGFSWFHSMYKRMLRWSPSFKVATTCFSCSSPNLNFLVSIFFHICVHVK